MLVIERQLGSSLYIGGDIRIVVTQVRRKRCWLGIEAPDCYRILREELLHRSPDELAGKDAAERLADQTFLDKVAREEGFLREQPRTKP